MIPLERSRAEADIQANFRGANRIAWARELMEAQRAIARGQADKHAFLASRWKPVKDQLMKESCDKCAFCEAPTTLVAYGDVEHYRPKGVYWWLAYCYDNYLASCQLCNQKFKSDAFPVRGRRMRGPKITARTGDAYVRDRHSLCGPDPLDAASLNDFREAHVQERPLLLNPYFDDPSKYYAWRVDHVLAEVELAPADAAAEPFVEAAVEHLGLNRRELKNQRYQYYVLFRTYRAVLADPGILPATRAAVADAMDMMRSGRSGFMGMIRYFDALAVLP